MKTSICITILNEEKAIGRLLESLSTQTKKPDEIIIVDGGSEDRTLEIIRHYQKKNRKIKLVVEKGGTAHGRNTAAELARFPIIVQIDAGCVARPDWLEKITTPFKHQSVGMVAGFYEMLAHNSLQEAMNVYHGVPPQRFDPKTFLPSARSVAFRKSVWEEVGGYSERLPKTGEDTEFFYKCVKKGVKIVRVEEARVVWEEPKSFTLKDSLKKFYSYAKGDATAGIWWHPVKQLASHNIKISAIFLRYLLGLALFVFTILGQISPLYFSILVSLYLIFPVWKWRDVLHDFRARLWLPIIQVSSDIAVMAGFLGGILGR